MANPYLAKNVTLELDFTGVTGAAGIGKIDVNCYLTGYQITTTPAETTEVSTMCPQGQFTLAGKPGGSELVLDFINDWCTDNSLSWLLATFPDASNIPFKLIDRAGCDTGIEVNGIISSLPTIQIGAQVGQLSTVSGAVFPLQGRPTITKAAKAPAITGVTAGSPGAFTPSGSIAPANLTTLKADAVVGDSGTAKPVGAWTTGQYVVLADGSNAHWDGAKWVAGKA